MSNIYVVGEEGSFTWDATIKRYGKGNRLIGVSSQPELLKKLSINGKNRIKVASVAPIWNSNSGTISFDQKTGENLTAGALKGDSGNVIDLWGRRIIFSLGLQGARLAHNGTVYSVAVAKAQCSDFFDKNKSIKFDSDKTKTTNIALRNFQKDKNPGNGLLCNIELLKKHKIRIIKGDFANPFNYTVFFGLNRYPGKKADRPKISLGCLLMDLQGQTGLPTDFITYWNDITKSREILSAQNILHASPKIDFILRYEQSKALVLLEMRARKDLSNPWLDISGDSNIDSLGQVGLLRKSFALETCELIKGLRKDRRKIIFYGKPGKGNCFWACPSLNISVHGFEPELVKNCAKIQVIRFSNLFKEGVKFSDEAVRILRQFNKNEALIKLAADSKPEDH